MVNHLNKTSGRSGYQYPNALCENSSSMAARPAGGALGLMNISKPQKFITFLLILLNRRFIYDPVDCAHVSLFSRVQCYRRACARAGRSCADGCSLTLTRQTDGGGDVVRRENTDSFAAQLLPP